MRKVEREARKAERDKVNVMMALLDAEEARGRRNVRRVKLSRKRRRVPHAPECTVRANPHTFCTCGADYRNLTKPREYALGMVYPTRRSVR